MTAQSEAAAIPHQDEPGEVVQVFDQVEISLHFASSKILIFEICPLFFLSTLTYSL